MSEASRLPVGISQPFACSYRPDQQEQLLIVQSKMTPEHFESLMAMGFRRSGDDVYRPHCPSCRACQPIRVPVKTFTPSRSQKRVLAKNRDLVWRAVEEVTEEQQALYMRYIRERHNDGPMYPPTQEQYQRFLQCQWLPQTYLEARLDGKLVMVAVTDVLEHSLSAVYTFFDPSLDKRSLGRCGILMQIEFAKRMGKHFLYLGYQIDQCSKMSYKTQYRPCQTLTHKGWKTLELV